MKRNILIMLLSVMCMSQLSAQDYEYIPFVREGVKWVCSFTEGLDEGFFTLELAGDISINGIEYKKMHKYTGDGIDPANDEVPVYLREEDRVVYGLVPDGKTSADCPIGIAEDTEMLEKIASGQEFVLYNFQDPIGFIEDFVQPKQGSHLVIPDMVTVAGKPAHRFIFSHMGGSYCMIEGVGYVGISQGYPLSLMRSAGKRIRLYSVEENGETIYLAEQHPAPTSPADVPPFLPIPREGVQWINQHVTVNGNDTTYSYYTYEFRGSNSRNYPILYRYEDKELDENAVNVATFQTFYNYPARHDCIVMDAPSVMEWIESGRSMMAYGTLYPSCQLYQFDPNGYEISSQNPVNYHIYNQKGDWLTRQNFMQVESLEIEGISCNRYAYVDEGGEVLAYLVEGIGFDSRDMGDLLTPFTRRPDPDAEYQEWCGLSHVIKDGEIIYKGLCYDEKRVQEAMALGEPGDLNGDGVVSITDVTMLIELVLNGPATGGPHRADGDMNGNGDINITDVVMLIEQVLQQ